VPRRAIADVDSLAAHLDHLVRIVSVRRA
jgi:hypothetical protein